MTGVLYIVSTPIGNLEDITIRALRILREADFIACEDTRVTGILLEHYNIPNNGRLRSYHSHSNLRKGQEILALLEAGKHVALVSDAGTPGISDPGNLLIYQAIERGILVSPIPGASALLAGIVASGLDAHQFLYLGFLPLKKGRHTLLESLRVKKYTVVIYESVHRILRTLTDLSEIFGNDHHITIGREITKKFEEFNRGTISEIRMYYEKDERRKGEFIIIF